MLTPKLTPEILNSLTKDLISSFTGLDGSNGATAIEYLEEVRKHDPEAAFYVSSLLLNNRVHAAVGFLLAYFAINRALVNAECAELDKLVK